MNWLREIAHSIADRVRQFHRSGRATVRRDRAPRIRYERMDDFPETLQPKTLYLAGDTPHLWAAAMLCPCRCGDTIHLNLLEQESPCWSVRFHRDGSVSVTPSVWRTKGCRSHFFIRSSRIEWCFSESLQSSGRIRRR